MEVHGFCLCVITILHCWDVTHGEPKGKEALIYSRIYFFNHEEARSQIEMWSWMGLLSFSISPRVEPLNTQTVSSCRPLFRSWHQHWGKRPETNPPPASRHSQKVACHLQGPEHSKDLPSFLISPCWDVAVPAAIANKYIKIGSQASHGRVFSLHHVFYLILTLFSRCRMFPLILLIQ